jgi:hypothetical protein
MTIATTSPNTIAHTRAGVHPLSVYDGKVFVGHLVRHDGNFEAVDVDGTSYGIFPNMKAVAFAIPARSVL